MRQISGSPKKKEGMRKEGRKEGKGATSDKFRQRGKERKKKGKKKKKTVTRQLFCPRKKKKKIVRKE